jgi:hypothetical protein
VSRVLLFKSLFSCFDKVFEWTIGNSLESVSVSSKNVLFPSTSNVKETVDQRILKIRGLPVLYIIESLSTTNRSESSDVLAKGNSVWPLSLSDDWKTAELSL